MANPFRADGLPVANLDAVLASDTHVDTTRQGNTFAARRGSIGQALGTKRLGINVTEVEPGKRAWPRHYHFANDELFVVLAGNGTLHYGEASGPIGPGDVIYIEAGTGIAFTLENTGAAPLRYLAIDGQVHPDVFVYPDSGKIGFMAGGPPLREGVTKAPKMVRFVTEEMKAGYWDGET